MLKKLEVYGLKSHKIIGFGENVFDNFTTSLEKENFEIQENDVVIITSKVFSMQENCYKNIHQINPSDKSKELAQKTDLDPRFIEIILQETQGNYYGTVYKAILTKTPYGLLANAGMDRSNAPKGTVLILPQNPDELAVKFRDKIKDRYGITVAVLIIDSRTIPLKMGTTALTIGASGIEPVIDERGNFDLYGYEITITSRAIADNIATAVNIVMGETNEQIPFGVIRGAEYTIKEEVDISKTMVPETLCLYFSPMMTQIKILEDRLQHLKSA